MISLYATQRTRRAVFAGPSRTPSTSRNAPAGVEIKSTVAAAQRLSDPDAAHLLTFALSDQQAKAWLERHRATPAEYRLRVSMIPTAPVARRSTLHPS